MKVFTFPKAEHICSRKEIEELFTPSSQSMTMFPLRTTFRRIDYIGHGPQIKVLISVSKRKFKHAVDRNRAKRQVREAYRLQKHLLLGVLPQDVALHVAFIWLSERPVDSRLVHKRMRTTLLRLAEKFQSEREQNVSTDE